MGDSLQDVYAQNLPKEYGYPLRIPEPSNTLPESYQNDGLHIGDVGYVDDYGRFQVLFNIHHSSQHALHRKRGVPADFQPLELDPEEVDVVRNAIPAKQVIQPPHLVQQLLQPSDERVEYEFVASSTGAGAVLILPFGTAYHDLKEKEVYRKIAAEQARRWCEFAKRNSLYLLTGFHKTRSWSLASFHNAERAGRIRVIRRVDPRDNVVIYNWEHTFPLHWRNGPAVDEDGHENQTVFISGFKIAVRWWAPEPVIVWVPQPGGIWFTLYVQLRWFVGFLFGLVNMVCRRFSLESLEHLPKLSQPFHPSDAINRYLLEKNPNAHVAVTHDSQWMTMLNQEELKYEDLAQEDRLWNFLSERYIHVSDDDTVYLQGKKEDFDTGELLCESVREFQGFSLCTTPISNAQIMITHMRVENIVTAAGHIPAGFYVIASVDGVEQRTKNKSVLLQETVIEWDDEILISPNSTFKVQLSVCSCFEFDPVLGRGEVLHTREISSEELVGNTHLINFLPKETGISPSLLLTLERRYTLAGGRSDIKPQLEGSPGLVEATDNGHAALLRFYRAFRKEDLENSIEQFERAVGLCPSGYDRRTPALFNLAIARSINSQVYGASSDLNTAILLFREVLGSRSLHHPDRPATLLRLAQALLHRYRIQEYQEFVVGEIEQLVTELRRISRDGSHERRAADLVHQTLKRLRVIYSYPPVELDELISELDLATRTPPQDYFDRSDRLENLRVALLARAELRRDVGDVDWAISMLEDAVRRIPDDHPDKHTYLINLGHSLLARFNIIGNVADLEQAIAKHETGVRVTPEHLPDFASHLCDLGVSLRIHFRHLGNLDDIESAVAKQERAITLTPTGHPDYAHRLYNLGLSLKAWFDQLKGPDHIDRAISIQQDAIRLIPECHPERPRFLNDLSLSFMARFELLGDLGDVEQAIAKHEDSVQLTPQEHPLRPLRLNDLGISQMTRFRRLGHLHDLQQAITRLEEAVQFTPLDSPRRASHLNSLGLAFCSRFNRLGDLEDIEQAIARQEEAVELTPRNHPDYPSHLNCLGRSNWSRFKRLTSLPDIQQAIERQEEAVKLTPRHDPNYTIYLNDLGLSYLARFEHVGDTRDLEQAVERHEDALELIPGPHPRHLNSLGLTFRARFSRLGNVQDIEQAIKLHEDAIQFTPHDHPNHTLYRNDLALALSLQARFNRFANQQEKQALQHCLCLICRQVGHVIESCPAFLQHDVTSTSIDVNHAHPSPSFEPSPTENNKSTLALCQRCKKMDGLSMITTLRPFVLEDYNVSHRKRAGRKTSEILSLGPIKSLQLRSSCSLCRLLFDITHLTEEDIEVSRSGGGLALVTGWTIHRLEKGLHWSGYDKGKGPYAKCMYTSVTSWSNEAYESKVLVGEAMDAIGLVDTGEHGAEGSPAFGVRKVDHQDCDYNLIKDWLRQCDHRHPITCHPIMSAGLKQIKLIDVETRKVVKYPPDSCDYIAISCVWGGVVQPSYKLGDVLPTVPTTLEDAMVVTRNLGKRYLWADSLCVDREREEELAAQIGLMDTIFAGAWATIICLSSRSLQSGLARVGTRKGVIPQMSLEVGGKQLLSVMPTLSQQISWSPWATRAWTFPDGLFSPRCIFFTNHQVYFECNAVQCCESLDDSQSPFHLPTNAQRQVELHKVFQNPDESVNAGAEGVIGRGIFRDPFRPLLIGDDVKLNRDALKIYWRLVHVYTTKKLTFNGDSLNAFSPLLTRLSETHYKKGFIQGLPVEDLPRALLWIHETQPRRRGVFAAWSWAGWEGPVKEDFMEVHGLQTMNFGEVDMPPLMVWKAGYGGLPELIYDFNPTSWILKEMEEKRPKENDNLDAGSRDEEPEDSEYDFKDHEDPDDKEIHRESDPVTLLAKAMLEETPVFQRQIGTNELLIEGIIIRLTFVDIIGTTYYHGDTDDEDEPDKRCLVLVDGQSKPLRLKFYGHNAAELVRKRNRKAQEFLLLSRIQHITKPRMYNALLLLDWEGNGIASRVGAANLRVDDVKLLEGVKPERKLFKLR